MACPTVPTFIRGCDFANWLVDQQPVYDKLILEDIRPTDGWIGHVPVGVFPSASGVTHWRDRFTHVFPDVTQQWNNTVYDDCTGTPCDKTEYCITWGSRRIHFALKEVSWATPVLCFDQLMHVTHAKEQFRYIITDILKPATSAIISDHFRKEAVMNGTGRWWAMASVGGTCQIVNFATAPQFVTDPTFSNTSMSFIDLPLAPGDWRKLTPQALQRRVQPLMQLGYFGKQPFKDMPPLIELVVDLETCWELDRLGAAAGYGGPNTPTAVGNWRFQQWDAASPYWRYGLSGQVGNYAVRVDPFGLRFDFVRQLPNGLYRYQQVLPYVNTSAASANTPGTLSFQSQENPRYQNAQFAIGFIWHKMAMEWLVADSTNINPEMPFSARNFGGRWQFVMDNLGADACNRVIENKRRNKGQFIMDIKGAIAPKNTELAEAIFYKREPSCLVCIDTCAAYPTYQYPVYDSCNASCGPCPV